jgi:hypothetical protein
LVGESARSNEVHAIRSVMTFIGEEMCMCVGGWKKSTKRGRKRERRRIISKREIDARERERERGREGGREGERAGVPLI